MVFKPEHIDRARGIAYGVLGLGIFFNFGAFIITVYMLENFSWLVYETNPIPAYVFANFGYAPMFLVSVSIWIAVFATLKYWGGKFGSKQQFFLAMFFVILLVPMVFWDFSNNFYYLSKVCLPLVIT